MSAESSAAAAAAFVAGAASANSSSWGSLLTQDEELSVHAIQHLFVDIIWQLFVFTIILVTAWALVIVAQAGLQYFLETSEIRSYYRRALQYGISLAMGMAAVVVAFGYLGISLSFILGLGTLAFILSPAIAKGAENAFEGILLNVEHEYQKDMYISIHDDTGKIVGMNLRRVQLFDEKTGNFINVPTSDFNKYTVTIITKKTPALPQTAQRPATNPLISKHREQTMAQIAKSRQLSAASSSQASKKD